MRLRPGKSASHGLWAAGGIAVICAAACGGKSGGTSGTETGKVDVHMVTPPAAAPDPFQGLTGFHLEVLENGAVAAQQDFGPSDPLVVKGLTPGTGRTVVLEGKDGASVLSYGRTLPFAFEVGQQISV